MESSLNPYISLNPYRIVGVLSNSGVKEIHKNLSKLKAFSQLNKKVEFDYDFNELNLSQLDRSAEIISKVESRILLDENKVKYSLFWFVDINPFDSIALANLTKGNIEKAIVIWDKTIKNTEINSANFSSYHNLGTILLLKSISNESLDCFDKSTESINNIKTAINYKIKLINSDYFKEFLLAIGVNSKISMSEIQSFFISTFIEILNINFSSKDLLQLSEGLDSNIVSALNADLVKTPLQNINNNIKNSSQGLAENESNGLVIGKQLIRDSNRDFIYLKETLGTDDYQFQSIADKLANQILQCGIVYYNATKDDLDYLSSYKYALAIAQLDKTKTRAEDAIKHCEEEKDANLCPSCQVNNVESTKYYTISLYKVTERNYWSNTVKYQQVELKVFFCKSCNIEISNNSNKENYVVWGSGLVGIIIGLIMDLEWGSLLIGFIGVVIGSMIGGSLFDGFKTIGINRSKIVKQYINEGWQFQKPGK